jgi:hypothetical protein
MMGWWFLKCNDFIKVLIVVQLANTTSGVKGSTKRGVIVQARAASPSIWVAFTHFMNGDAHCGSKSSLV